jgi:amino acid transporter
MFCLKKYNLRSVVNIAIFIFSSQIGSGVFILPAILSVVGMKGIGVLLIIGGIATIITHIFANTGDNSHEIIGKAFGNKIGNGFFLLYWFISWFSTVVLFKELVGYIGIPYPYGFIIEIGIWLFVTFFNIRNLNNMLFLETCLTFLKILPFIGLLFMYSISFWKGNISTINSTESINIKLFLRCLWGFVGLETGNIIGKNLNINNKDRKIGTYIGMIGVISFYVFSVFFAFKILGTQLLIGNQAPYVTIFQKGLEGIISINNIKYILKFLVIVVLFGSINSWTISSGYSGYEGGKLNILPKIFQKVNKNQVPYMSIIISSLGVLVFLILGINNNIYHTTVKFIDISTCFFLLIYAMCIYSYSKVYITNVYKKFFYYFLAFLMIDAFFIEIFNSVRNLFI